MTKAREMGDLINIRENKNVIINGNFDIWQRGTSLASGTGTRYLADRWLNQSSGSTYTASRQAFTLGQTAVPNNPKYFHRQVATSVVGINNFALLQQRIEDVSTFSNEEITVSFWAKADVAKNIATEFVQFFGTGGAPSADVNAIGVTTHALTTSWQKFTVTTTIPSISGKALGTNNDDFLQCRFWFDAGSSFDLQTNTLGQQSGTFDIAQVQIEKGAFVTDFERKLQREIIANCERYYSKSFDLETAPGTVTQLGRNSTIANSGGFAWFQVDFPEKMRTIPTITTFSGIVLNSSGTYAADGSINSAIASISVIGETAALLVGSAGTGESGNGIQWTADAEL